MTLLAWRNNSHTPMIEQSADAFIKSANTLSIGGRTRWIACGRMIRFIDCQRDMPTAREASI